MTKDEPSNKKPSLRTELNLKIMLLVLTPLLISAVYFSYHAYNQAIGLAYENVYRSANSLTLDLRTEISAQKYSFSDLSESKTLGEVSINLLYSQYAFNQIKSLVNNSSLIDAAFISDGSEFIIEGFPLETLKLAHSSVIEKANSVIKQHNDKKGAELFFLSQKQANLASKRDGYLFIVLPLRKKMASLVQPYQNTAAIFLLLNPSNLLTKINTEPHAAIELTVNEQPYYRRQWENIEDLVTVKDTVYSKSLDDFNIKLRLGHKIEQYTDEVLSAIGINILLIFVLFFVVVWFTHQFSRRLSQPIKLLEQQSKRYINGEYITANNNVEFSELETLQQTLNAMSNTITQQISHLQDARDKAEASEKMKARFLANMSHEIRTPLNGVNGLMKMIASEPLSVQQKSWLESADHSAQLLLTVVNDILDFSKIEAGKVTLEIIPNNFKRTLNNINETATTLLKDKDLVFSITNELEHDYWHYDSVRLAQILVNIVSNAIKFTNKGSINLAIKQETNLSGEDNIIITITDTGIGITKEQTSNLFKSFAQADVSTTRKFGGTGLGLAITQQLTKLMNGNITVDSTVGQGSIFTLTLPMKRAEPTQDENSEMFVVPNFTKHKILIAEDNKINQTILNHAIKPTHAQISVVGDGKQALEQISDFKPDIILMDVQMPVMDGVEATKKIRASGYKGIIIMQTANVLAEEISEYLRVGANAHIAKPIDAKKLLKLLGEYLSANSH